LTWKQNIFSPRNSEFFLDYIEPGAFNSLGELPSTRPLTIGTTVKGLAFDFNCGLRLKIPAGNYHVKIFDHDSETLCFEGNVSDTLLISIEKFFVRWEFFIYRKGKLLFHYILNPTGRKVHFHYLKSGIGDRFALFPYMEEFRKRYDCKASCTVESYLQEIIKLYFPEIKCAPP